MHVGIETHGFWGQSEGQAKAIRGLIQGLSRIDETNRYTLFVNALRYRSVRREVVRRQIDNPRFDIKIVPLPNTPHPVALFFA